MPASQSSAGSTLARRPVLEFDRPQQLGEVERVAAACRPDRRAQLIARLFADGSADECADSGFAQQRRAGDRRRLGPQRGSDVQWTSRSTRRSATSSATSNPSIRARGTPASEATARQPNARRRRRSAAAGGPRGWQSASTARARRRMTCRTPSAGELAQQQRAHGASWAGEQRLALLSLGSRNRRSNSWRTTPNAKSASCSDPRARRTSIPVPAARRHAASTSDVFPMPAPPSTKEAPPRDDPAAHQLPPARARARAALSRAECYAGPSPPRRVPQPWMSAVGDLRKMIGMNASRADAGRLDETSASRAIESGAGACSNVANACGRSLMSRRAYE